MLDYLCYQLALISREYLLYGGAKALLTSCVCVCDIKSHRKMQVNLLQHLFLGLYHWQKKCVFPYNSCVFIFGRVSVFLMLECMKYDLTDDM